MPAENPGHAAEHEEIKEKTDDEEGVVQVTGLRIEQRILTRRLIPPEPKVPLAAEDQHPKEKDEDGDQRPKVFQLPPDQDRPLGIGRVMDDGPKERAQTK